MEPEGEGDVSATSTNRLSGRSITSLTRLPHSACIWPGVQNDTSDGDNYVSEVVSSRRFSGLYNAANRSRPGNIEQFCLSGDDSIIGEATAVDSTDGVELRTKRLDMSFSLWDAASLMFSISSYFLDLITDIAVACFHYLNNDYWYCALTLAFVMLPNLVTTSISLRWYIVDSKLEGSEPISKSQWLLRFFFHVFQIGPVLRYYESLKFGMKFRETKDPVERRKIYMRMVYEDADATMLRLFESFMESAPQLMLQMYIITQNYPFNDYEYWTGELMTS